jgi:hypothetical protein
VKAQQALAAPLRGRKVVDGETEGFYGRARCEGAERGRPSGEQRAWGGGVCDEGSRGGFWLDNWRLLKNFVLVLVLDSAAEE